MVVMPLSALGMGRATVPTTLLPSFAPQPRTSLRAALPQPIARSRTVIGPFQLGDKIETEFRSIPSCLELGKEKRKSVLCLSLSKAPPSLRQFPPNHCTLVPKASSNGGFLPSDGLGPAHANVSPGHGGEPGVQGRYRDSK